MKISLDQTIEDENNVDVNTKLINYGVKIFVFEFLIDKAAQEVTVSHSGLFGVC